MRKRYKRKRRTSKWNKVGVVLRWSGREEQRLKLWEKQMRRGSFD
jgi:hypothetical protein